MSKISVKIYEGMGRGIKAEQDFKVYGEIVHIAELLVLSPEDTISINKTALADYTFVFDGTRDCLALGLGEIFNHDDNPNVSYTIENVDGRKQMVFRAIAKIKQGEQLFINYNADIKSNAKYTANLFE